MSAILKEKLGALIDELAFLRLDWDDLGWTMDGAPDSDLCDEFEEKLMRINELRTEVAALLNQ